MRYTILAAIDGLVMPVKGSALHRPLDLSPRDRWSDTKDVVGLISFFIAPWVIGVATIGLAIWEVVALAF